MPETYEDIINEHKQLRSGGVPSLGKGQYRLLVIALMILILMSFLHYPVSSDYPEGLYEYSYIGSVEKLEEILAQNYPIIFFLYGLLWLSIAIAHVVSLLGLLIFSQKARFVYLITIILIFLWSYFETILTPGRTVTLYTNGELILSTLSHFLIWTILFASYYSNIALKFKGDSYE